MPGTDADEDGAPSRRLQPVAAAGSSNRLLSLPPCPLPPPMPPLDAPPVELEPAFVPVAPVEVAPMAPPAPPLVVPDPVPPVGGQCCESFHSLSAALIFSVLSTSKMGFPLAVNSSIR